MNPKIALFLSTTLTAFVVATLSGVVNKVTSVSASNATPVQAVVQQVATATLAQPTDQPTDLPTATAIGAPDPMQAATLASQAINRQDVYSVETSTYNGVNAYKVVFSSGDVVYIGMDAKVLAKTKSNTAAANVQTAPTKKPHRNNGGGQPSYSPPSNNGGSSGGGGGGGGSDDGGGGGGGGDN